MSRDAAKEQTLSSDADDNDTVLNVIDSSSESVPHLEMVNG